MVKKKKSQRGIEDRLLKRRKGSLFALKEGRTSNIPSVGVHFFLGLEKYPISSVRELAHGCIRHQIGDGKGTKLWTDPWLPEVIVFFFLRKSSLLQANERSTQAPESKQNSHQWVFQIQ